MKYSKFKKIKNLDLKLLNIIGAVTSRIALIRINTYPDFNKLDYQKASKNTFSFEDKWTYRGIFKSILNCEILDVKLLQSDDFPELKNNFNIDLSSKIHELRNEDKDNSILIEAITTLGSSTKNDNFNLHQINLSSIENNMKNLTFSGAYEAFSDAIDPVDWGLYIACSITAISIFNENFYQELIAEAFHLKNEHNNKLSFFILFSALENFINEEMNTHNTQTRLTDILKNMYQHLNTSEIYTSIIGEFSHYEKTRNSIAHGREYIEIEDDLLFNFFIFTLTLIALYKTKIYTFQQLADA